MNAKKRLNPRRALILAAASILSVLLFAFGENMKLATGLLLSSSWSRTGICIYCTLAVVFNGIYTEKAPNKSGLLFRHFNEYADILFGAGTFVFAGTTSLSLMKGLYFQFFYEKTHFTQFDNFDLVSILLIAVLLFI